MSLKSGTSALNWSCKDMMRCYGVNETKLFMLLILKGSFFLIKRKKVYLKKTSIKILNTRNRFYASQFLESSSKSLQVLLLFRQPPSFCSGKDLFLKSNILHARCKLAIIKNIVIGKFFFASALFSEIQFLLPLVLTAWLVSVAFITSTCWNRKIVC